MPSAICNNDMPTTEDALSDSSHFTVQLADEIRQSIPPKTFAITGYWGAGKTSALAMLYKELTGQAPPGFAQTDEKPADENCIGIWFEAWRYQNETMPIVALLQVIKKHFSQSDKLLDKAKKLAGIAIYGALTVMDGVIKTAANLSGFDKIQAAGEKYEKDNLMNLLVSDQVNDALSKAIDVILHNGEDLTGKPDKRLVIFIDDIDRCEPETAYSLLEGLKLYLNIPNCTIVMALDPQQVEASLVKKLGENPGNPFHAVEYMEKLCQDAYRLPVPRTKQRNTFLIKLLNDQLSGRNAQDHVPDIASVLENYDCLPANPRRLKMLANKIALFLRCVNPDEVKTLKVAKEAGLREFSTEDKRNEVFAIAVLVVASMAVNYRRLYERIEKSSKFVSELFEFCNTVDFEPYTQRQSVFYEFEKPSVKLVEHPSDLSVFRLKTIFGRGQNGIEERYAVDEAWLGVIMHQLIEQFVNPGTKAN